MNDCLFCKIIDGQIPSTILYEDENLVAFNDVNPQAPLHVLIVPRKHVATLNELSKENDVLIGAMQRLAASLAKDNGVHEEGYRTVFNTNKNAGQTVFHIHLHLLAGRQLNWPPG
jgi:histidine triad (HIT) family protein